MRKLIVVGVIFAVCVSIGYFLLRKADPLPVYEPYQLNPSLVDESLHHKKTGHTISDFSLTNQEGKTVTLEDLKGKVVVADFFFTTCGTICPLMSDQLERVQERYANEKDLLIVSHSVLPDNDNVEVLHRYAEQHQANPEQWYFLTGDQEEIFTLARKSYFAVLPGSDGAEEGFVHTQNFVLVDKLGRLRGFYDGTSSVEVDQLMNDMELLFME